MSVEHPTTGSSIIQVSLKKLLGAWPSTLAHHRLRPPSAVTPFKVLSSK